MPPHPDGFTSVWGGPPIIPPEPEIPDLAILDRDNNPIVDRSGNYILAREE